MTDEGVIKFDCHWTRAAPLPPALLEGLQRWRARLYALGLIGCYADSRIGYGNLSVRDPRCAAHVIITGSQTGHLESLGPEHYALVTGHDFEGNRVDCEGPVRPSSEALTHLAIYALDARYEAVVHVHDAQLWSAWLDRLPTTRASVPYGTPAMAGEFARLHRESDLPRVRVAVMGGHREGIVAFGETLDEAGDRLLRGRTTLTP